ncbi:MAG TPA: glycoside hydrolase [Pirellulales bacterium]|nr:glycoside hydrolase [Pirellulales bacterium]
MKFCDDSPVAPALLFRDLLVRRGEFVTFDEKCAIVPRATRLIGAAHAYLWGDGVISRHNVTDWRKLANVLLSAEVTKEPTPAYRLWLLLESDGRRAIRNIAKSDAPSIYDKREAAQAIGVVLECSGFYDSRYWRTIQGSRSCAAILRKGCTSPTEVAKANAHLLAIALPGMFSEVDKWGDGVSIEMLDRLHTDGFDKMCLCFGDLSSGTYHQDVLAKADRDGLLVGPYDSYHTIHAPNTTRRHSDEVDVTWETASFDWRLFRQGPVLSRDCKPVPGFQGTGFALSPIAAFPYVKSRVSRMMRRGEYSAWFVDCDAAGELLDDFSSQHTASQRGDANWRLRRLKWISNTWGIPVGSEGGAAFAVPAIDFAHGIATPVIGFGDPDLTDPKSQYWLGGNWPSDGPRLFMSSVPLKPEYQAIYFEPRFRLPLYQTVFHDSLISTHHWTTGSLKFLDQAATVELIDMLYCVPPLYHLNLDEYAARRDRICRHYQVFTRVHRLLAGKRMTAFDILTEDRLVQRTSFGNRSVIVANFGESPYSYSEKVLPPRSVMIDIANERGSYDALWVGEK